MASYAQSTMWDPVLRKRVARTAAPTPAAPTSTPAAGSAAATSAGVVGTTAAPKPVSAPTIQSSPSNTLTGGAYKSGMADDKARTLEAYQTYVNTGQTDKATAAQSWAQNQGYGNLDELWSKPPVTPAATTPVAEVPTIDTSMDSLWNKVRGMIPQNEGESSTSITSDYGDILSTLKAQTDPLYQQKLKKLQTAQNEAEMSLRRKMSESGAYDSSEMDKQLAKLSGDYLTATSDYSAQTDADLANMANSMYQSSMSRKSGDKASYNSMIGNLAQMYMSGAIDLVKFAQDDAYRRSVLANNTAMGLATNF